MAFKRLQCFAAIPQGPLWVLATLTSFDGKLAVGNVDLIDEQGQVVLRMEGARLQRVSRDWISRLVAGPVPDWCYELAWTAEAMGAAAVDETAVEPGRWLIYDSRDGAGTGLAERFRMKAHECTVVSAETTVESRRTAIEEFLAAPGPAMRGVIYLSGLDVAGEAESPDFAAARRDGWGAVLDLVHALTAFGKAKPPRLWLVTRGGHAAGEASPLALGQSPVWGLGRVIAAEHPELACTRIDLDPANGHDDADQLAEEILSGQREDQVAYRGDQRLVARLRRLDAAEAGSCRSAGPSLSAGNYRRGELDHVALQPVERQAPGLGQVEIKVRATGLNFRDVLNVLNLYPGDPGPLGGECAGEIAAVGPGVENFKVGRSGGRAGPGQFCQLRNDACRFRCGKTGGVLIQNAGDADFRPT